MLSIVGRALTIYTESLYNIYSKMLDTASFWVGREGVRTGCKRSPEVQV